MLKEIDDYLVGCSAAKIGMVLDNTLAKLQHIRVGKESGFQETIDKGRAKIFSSLDECVAWLRE